MGMEWVWCEKQGQRTERKGAHGAGLQIKHLAARPAALSLRQPFVETSSQLVLLRPLANQIPRATDQSREIRPHGCVGMK